MNPFDEAVGRFRVLANEGGRRCLWPVFMAVPDGWVPAFGPADRRDCLAHIEGTGAEDRSGAGQDTVR